MEERTSDPTPAEGPSGLSYRMTAPSRARTPGIARDWVVSLLRGSGWGEGLRERARLCTSEVVTNAYRHTDTREITVEVVLGDGWVTVYVYDCAPERWPSGGAGIPLMAPGGRGLALVGAYADEWAAVAQGDCVKVVWFSLR
jgi:anti-sigma regulatory factor (Ser/Thr protein kinase)